VDRDDGRMTTTGASSSADNSVFLRGRVAGETEFRDLPSGDVLAVFRITVRRPAGERSRVDSIECSSTRARVRQTLGRLQPGDEVEANGSLRRRFWQTPSGPASRYSVDVATMRVLSRSGRRGAA
jgi:single-strand DNA-binding protein